jgi:hypothetical protein
MAIISEDYVSFETAKLLKDKGFNQNCATYYLDGQVWRHYHGEVIPKGKQTYAAPTQAIAMKWLREVHNLFIEIQCYGCEADEKAHFEYSYVISEYVKFNTGICTTFGLEERNAKSKFPSYEEACEAAIKYCLENLI